MSIIERALEKAATGGKESSRQAPREPAQPPNALGPNEPDEPGPNEPGPGQQARVIQEATEPLVDLPGDEGPRFPDAAALAAVGEGGEDPPLYGPAPPGAGLDAQPEVSPSPATSERVELDYRRLGRAAIITPDQPEGLLAEQFRIIKRPLLMRAAAERAEHTPNANLMLVTSSLPGEGKSFTAANLAMSIATELDQTVLLVDADAHRAGISVLLGLEDRPGLVEHLLNEEPNLSRLLLRTNIDTLTVLPSGRRVERLPELLASQESQRLMRELSMRYEDRIVIIDSPPLLATSDASVLAHHAGQVVLVVEAVRTPQSAIKEGIGRLHGLDNVSLVLNKSRQRPSAAHRDGAYGAYEYGGYGGYGYGQLREPA